MKRINITVDEKTEAILKDLKEKGYTTSSAIRISLQAFMITDDGGRTIKVPEKHIPVPREIAAELKEYKEKDRLCPLHPDQPLSKCGCGENGQLQNHLMRYAGLIE